MPISLWLDGCFDGFHYAHANAIRQALFLMEGASKPRIVVGVHSDEEIRKNKGPPLFDQTERYNTLRGCRWIDQIVEDVPYTTSFDVTFRHGIDFVVHGDDIVLDAEGNDCYGVFRETGKYKECNRTEGISTTALIQRILQPSEWTLTDTDHARLENLMDLFVQAVPYTYPLIRYDTLSPNHDLVAIRRVWSAHKKIVYIGGSWDCFGAGHVELLRRAKCIADNVVLVVGIWSDKVLQARTWERPLLALRERALAIIQCKYSDALILSPPVTLPQHMVEVLGIEMLVNSETPSTVNDVHIEVPLLQTVPGLRRRLLAQRDLYEERQRRKGA
ncbi:Nucleotidylyl transferase [Gautieria morchelliformis]|nr:Nucleotidylyl transferase [Gautieria morchelliformis]